MYKSIILIPVLSLLMVSFLNAADSPSTQQIKQQTEKIQKETLRLKQKNTEDKRRLKKIQALIEQLRQQNQSFDAKLDKNPTQ